MRIQQKNTRSRIAQFCKLLGIALFLVHAAAWAAAPQSDLAIGLSVNNTAPREGDTLVYTLTLTNNGPSTDNSIQVTDVLPASVTYVSDNSGGNYNSSTGVWSAAPPKLAAGGVLVMQITVTVNTGTLGTTFTNTATITHSTNTDPVTSNNSSSVSLTVVEPNLTMLKSALTTSDPVNGTSSPYNIPGATVLYSLQTTNTGKGVTDANSVVVTDPIPPNTVLYVGDLGGAGSGPVLFVDGAAPANSGLTYTFSGLASTTDDLEFSNDNGTTWTYVPVPDANGYDANVTNIRVNPQGVMNGSNGTTNPTFTLRFRVKVQ